MPKGATLAECMDAGVYAAGRNHSTTTYKELATMHPESKDLYFLIV